MPRKSAPKPAAKKASKKASKKAAKKAGKKKASKKKASKRVQPSEGDSGDAGSSSIENASGGEAAEE